MAKSKFSFITLLGRPNAGKSTLMNKLIGFPLSIVTPKAQTTRASIKGITTIDNTQLIFQDAPGILEPKRKLDKAMLKNAWACVKGATTIIILIDVNKDIDKAEQDIIAKARQETANLVIVLNKIDKASKARLQETYSQLSSIVSQDKVTYFEISALRSKNTDKLLSYLISQSEQGPWPYNQEEITTASSRYIATEITRKHLFMALKQELPYNLMVENESWQTQSDGSVKINQVIHTNKDSHKKIIVGKDANKLKKIGQHARREIDTTLGIKCHLFLYVKVKPDWEDDDFMYQSMGLLPPHKNYK